MLGILDGQDLYAHIGALRGDGVVPEVLDMGKIIGDDSLRRALAKGPYGTRVGHVACEFNTQKAHEG